LLPPIARVGFHADNLNAQQAFVVVKIKRYEPTGSLATSNYASLGELTFAQSQVSHPGRFIVSQFHSFDLICNSRHMVQNWQ
jgi:hypothetical protein